MPLITLRNRRFAKGRLLASIAAVATAAATLTGLGTSAGAATASPTPRVDVAQAAAQCSAAVLGQPQAADATNAAAIMGGRANLAPYGTLPLPDKGWRPVRSLDASGNDHINGLHWLLPLLREGVRTHNSAMVRQFYLYVASYLGTFSGPLSRQQKANPVMWNPMDAGYRATTLVCAIAGPAGAAPWLARALAAHATTLATNPWDAKLTPQSNNTYLHAQLGLLSAACAMHNTSLEATARARIGLAVGQLVNTDGSTREGSLSYASSDYRWLHEAHDRLAACGLADVPQTRLSALPTFLANATRPDGFVENIGDGVPFHLPVSQFPDTAAEWAATAGASGEPVSAVFSSWQGGLVFGRSGWGTCRPWSDETFYSVRTGSRNSYHAHDDTGALTLYSHGSELLLDDGQYAYVDNSRRAYVVSRAAHNTLNVEDAKSASYSAAATSVSVAHGVGGDAVRIDDRDYAASKVALTRWVYYDRAGDFFVVADRVSAPATHTYSQHWQLPPGRTVRVQRVTPDQTMATTSGPGANVSLFSLRADTTAPAVSVADGQSRPSLLGWTSRSYGDFIAAPMVRMTTRAESTTLVTVIVPTPADAGTADAWVSGMAGPTGASVTVHTPAADYPVQLSFGRTAVAPQGPAADCS